MVDEWWSLPGPNLFVARIERDLREGRSVVVSMPQYAPGQLRAAVYARLREDLPFTTVHLSEETSLHPLDILYSRCASDLTRDARRSALAFAERDDSDARVIWIDEVDANRWPDWRWFLREYEQACRAVPERRRTLLCVVRSGEAAGDAVTEDVCLAEHRYHRFVTGLDTLLFVSRRLASENFSPTLRRLLAAVIARLAVWDPGVASRLAALRPEDILDPMKALKEFGEQRGWSEATPVRWEAGTLEDVDGRTHAHSASLVFEDSQREIARRLWSAQVEVLFPWVEEQRRGLLDALSGVLRVPFAIDNGTVINDIRDLEVGVIWYQLQKARGMENKRPLARLLRDVRNSLSHLEPLSVELALRACRT